MKAWPRLRIVCSLLLGLVAGLLMWILPQPWPTFTLALPAPAPGEEGAAFTLQAISSDARHVITFGKHHAEKWKTLHVWDRQRGLDKPMITVPLDQEGWTSYTTLFSPDEQTLAVAIWYWPKKRNDLVWFDLRTGAKIKGVELEMDHILFALDGKLLYVNAGVVRDLHSGEGLRKLDATIDGFKYQQSDGEFAIYRKENRARLYSYLTGQKGDTSSRVFDEDDVHFGKRRVMTPDGTILTWCGPRMRHPWLAKWWPVKDSDTSFYVTRWKTDERLAEFRNVNHLCFSPRGNQLAVMRADLAIDVYDFPLRKPWWSIVGVALAAAIGTWGVGWLWGPWRLRRTPAVPASPPPSA